ncbi:DUF975 family protein [Lacticaseibacillus absianus]|uniref:DUF975 family protein n=1 Tax=Lacticaseibacillus absianus TaxID=2729623 RepID=UPI0015CDC948|nr:DUF975 family protein [Lacticaseibacillus absianus]
MAQQMTRRELKRRAKAQLRAGGNYRDLVVANLVPWLIGVVFAVIGAWIMFETITSFGVENIAANPNNFIDYYSGKDQAADRQLMEALIGLWFTQGIAFTALDIARDQVTGFNPVKAIFRTFTSRYFFGMLAIWLLVNLLVGLGLFALVVPGILLAYGLGMTYYTYYDGRQDGAPYSVFTAMGDSWRIMRGHKFDYFVLNLSMLGWTILEYATFHLFDLLIDPYLQVVRAGFYDNVRTLYYQDN